jgi:phosphoglycolate phosphatase (TIGR01487 family)
MTDESLRLSPELIGAMQEAARRGLTIIVVSGRMLDFLIRLSQRLKVFDALVAENGAVIYLSRSMTKTALGELESARIRNALKNLEGQLEVGEVIVATKRWNEARVRGELEKAGVVAHIEYNRESLMVLPAGVDKGSGVLEAVRLMGLTGHGLACIGDAENDIPMLRVADFSAAVANAVDEAKRVADMVCRRSYGDGVVEFIETILAHRLERPNLGSPHRAR